VCTRIYIQASRRALSANEVLVMTKKEIVWPWERPENTWTDKEQEAFRDYCRQTGKRPVDAAAMSAMYQEYRESIKYINDHLKGDVPKKFKKLTDNDVIVCRRTWAAVGTNFLALKFNVHRNTIDKAVKGLSFKHLNSRYKPWQ
jgi:hypothetical protein